MVTALPCPPLYGTPRTLDRPTLGPRVAEVHRALGCDPLPHQRYIYDVAFELDPDTGYLAYDEVVVIGPRQATGKTEIMLPVCTYRCVAFDDELAKWSFEHLGREVRSPGKQRVVYTAQTADDARLKWRQTHLPRLRASRYRRQFRSTLQRNWETLTWRDGSTWSPASTTARTGGTGDTIDLPVIDEAWSRPDDRTELSMRPARLTRWWSQLWVLSMVPGISRAQPGTWPYLDRKRELGRAAVRAGVRTGTAFFDFAAPDGSDPADPKTWRAAMPGLGVLVPERFVRKDQQDMNPIDFGAEYLGWKPEAKAPRWTLVPRDEWRSLFDPGSRIAGSRAFAIEFNEQRTRAWIGVAGKRSDGHWHVEVVEPGGRVPAEVVGTDWVESRISEMIEDWEPCVTVIDKRRPASSLVVPLRNKFGKSAVYTPPAEDVAGGCGRFYDAITGVTRDEGEPVSSRIRHLGQPELDDALAAGRTWPWGSGQSFTFVHKTSAGDICPLYVVTLAMLGAEVYGVDDYDLLDSVDSSRRCQSCSRFVYPDGGTWRHASDETPECQ